MGGNRMGGGAINGRVINLVAQIAEYRFIKDFGAQPIEAIASADDGSSEFYL